MIQAYRKKYGKELLDQLGSLFVDCDGAKGFRFRYWHLMNLLYTENFIAKVYRWCQEHDCQLTGHAIEERTIAFQMACCGGVMPFYEYENIPGVDCLCRGIGDEMMPRQVSSVAQQLGKKQVLTETFAATGWDVTPRELKRIAEWQYVHGVNLMCHHLYPYSIRGQRKQDYPSFYSEHNPWTKSLSEFNDYFTSLGYLLAESKESAEVLIIHPMHSAYLTYNREEHDSSVQTLSTAFAELIEKLGAAGIGHHYGDEVIMARHGSIEDGKLRVSMCVYDTVVIPDCQTLDSSTIELLREYVAQGGKLWLAGQKPDLVDGEPADLSFLSSNTDFCNIAAEKALWRQRDTSIRATMRKMNDRIFVYAVNLSEDENARVDLQLPVLGVEQLDVESQNTYPLDFLRLDNGVRVPLILEPGESVVVLQNDLAEAGETHKEIVEVLPIPNQAKVTAPVCNAYPLDVALLSFDGVSYTEPMPIMAISDRLLRERKNRPIWLKFSFSADHIPEDLCLEAEYSKDHRVIVNGKELTLTESGRLDRSFIGGRISEFATIGQNEVILQLEYYQTDHVYDVFNGFFYGNGEVTETLYNCLTYNTNIEAIYLFGQFAVDNKSLYRQMKQGACIAEGPFVLKKQPQIVNIQSITESGFPFFSGSIVVETIIHVTHTAWILRCKGRYQYIRVWVNGREVDKLLLRDTCDLRQYLHEGENTIAMEIMSSNRNLFGPHHVAGDPEPQWVGPIEFSRYGTWDDGKSEAFDSNYALVRFGLDTFQLETNV